MLYFNGTSADDVYIGGNGDDQIFGGGGDDILSGGNGDDQIYGESGNDILNGDDGNDRLFGGWGNNTLFGGAGNDDLFGDGGHDWIDGGAGRDIAHINGLLFYEPVVFTLSSTPGATSIMTVKGLATTSLINIEAVDFTGGSGNDILTGGDDDDSLQGAEGDDTLIGGAGSDVLCASSASGGFHGRDNLYGGIGDDRGVLDFANAWQTVQFSLDMTPGSRSAVLLGGLESTWLSDIESVDITGGRLADRLIGGAGNDVLDGGPGGNDILAGGAGDDVLKGGVGDRLIGGTGNDLAELGLRDTTAAVRFTLDPSPTATSQVFVGGKAVASVAAVEAVSISSGSGNDEITGGAGDDRLFGGTGNDILFGGAGNDFLFGGDLYGFASPLAPIERDFLDGGDGIDTASLGAASTATSMVFVFDPTPGAISNVIVDGVKTTAVRNIENFATSGTFGDDLITLGSGDDKVYSLGGKDRLDGGGGSDLLELSLRSRQAITLDLDTAPGVAADLLIGGVWSGSIANFERLDIIAGWSHDRITGGVGKDDISGGDGNDFLSGNDGDDYLSGDAGKDRLDGGAGADFLAGGSGDDIYIVDAGDTVEEAAASGIDTVYTDLSSYRLGDNLERLFYSGTGRFTGIGNALDNTLTGRRRADHLEGGDGNDTLTGGLGADDLVGGAGADHFIYASVADSNAEGFDTIADVSTLDRDRIDLSAIDANTTGGTSNDAFVFIGSAAFSGHAGELRYMRGVVQADVDGDALADLAIRLVDGKPLTKGSFVL